MSQQTATTTITDIASKYGKSKKGAWELATITGADGHKYKTFDKPLIERAKEILASGNPVEILFEATEKTFTNEKNEQIPYTDREIKDFAVKTGNISAKPAAAGAAPAAQPAYSEKNNAIEFNRAAHQSALIVCGEIMAACITAGVETYKFDDAIRVVQSQAKQLYASYFKSLEGGSDDRANDSPIDEEEETEIVE